MNATVNYITPLRGVPPSDMHRLPLIVAFAGLVAGYVYLLVSQ